MIGAGILPRDHDHLRLVEIVEPDRALPDPDRLTQAAAPRLVAHVGAVRQVVGSEFAHEELIEKGRLVAGPPAGVEDGLVGAGERVQLARHQREGLVPGDGLVVRRSGTQRHRDGEPALLPQPVIALPGELGDAVPREEVGVDASGRALFGDCLGAVLAKLERAAVAVRLRPGAAGTVEPVELVQRQEQPGAADRPGLAECVANGGDHRREAASSASGCFALQRHGPFRGLRASVAGIARLAPRAPARTPSAPPCDSTSRLTVARPSPMPGAEVLGPRKYGSKIRGPREGGIPGPVSSTSKTTRPRRCRTRRITSRNSALPRYLSPLRSRLPRRLRRTPGLQATAQSATSPTRSEASRWFANGPSSSSSPAATERTSARDPASGRAPARANSSRPSTIRRTRERLERARSKASGAWAGLFSTMPSAMLTAESGLRMSWATRPANCSSSSAFRCTSL